LWLELVLELRRSREWRSVVVGRRVVVGKRFVAGLGLDLSLKLSEVLLHLPDVVVRQHDRMPAVGPGFEHGPLSATAVGVNLQSAVCGTRSLSS
jgi:hypothetical protein